MTEWCGEHAAVVDNHVNYIDRLAEYEDSDMTPTEFKEAVDCTLELNKRLRPFFEAFASACKYPFEIPGIGMCCDAYSQSKRPDGRHWANYPECEAKNCPRLYPELLGDAKL